MNFLDYIFYRVYRFQLFVGNYLTPIGSTIIGITAVILINLFSIIMILSLHFNFSVLIFQSFVVTMVLLFLIIGAIFTIIFLKKKRYHKIINTYKNENKNQLRKGNAQILIYLIFTLLLLYFSFYMMYKRNN
jgi:uncharacterized membrane protein YbhN (UPF0104 family)